MSRLMGRSDHCLSADVPPKCLWPAGEMSEDVPQAASSVAPKVAGFSACAKHRVGLGFNTELTAVKCCRKRPYWLLKQRSLSSGLSAV